MNEKWDAAGEDLPPTPSVNAGRTFAMHATGRAYDLGLSIDITPPRGDETISIVLAPADPMHEWDLSELAYSLEVIKADKRGPAEMAAAEVDRLAEGLEDRKEPQDFGRHS